MNEKYKINNPDIFECRICGHQQLTNEKCNVCSYDTFNVKNLKEDNKNEGKM
jgi:ribosomal protein L37E